MNVRTVSILRDDLLKAALRGAPQELAAEVRLNPWPLDVLESSDALHGWRENAATCVLQFGMCPFVDRGSLIAAMGEIDDRWALGCAAYVMEVARQDLSLRKGQEAGWRRKEDLAATWIRAWISADPWTMNNHLTETMLNGTSGFMQIGIAPGFEVNGMGQFREAYLNRHTTFLTERDAERARAWLACLSNDSNSTRDRAFGYGHLLDELVEEGWRWIVNSGLFMTLFSPPGRDAAIKDAEVERFAQMLPEWLAEGTRRLPRTLRAMQTDRAAGRVQLLSGDAVD